MTEQPQIETDSRTWRAVKAWAEQRMASSRAAIEAPGLPAIETEYQRGRLAVMKELLALPEPRNIKTVYSADAE